MVKVKCFRVITDEPVGFALGFMPTGVIADEEEITIESADGLEYAYMHDHTGKRNEFPEPDMNIWRSQEEMEADLYS